MKVLDKRILFNPVELKSSLAHKSVKGGVVSMTSQGILFVLNLIHVVVLARLLSPSDFGLIGMVAVVIGFAGMFKDAGLSMVTIQSEKITNQQVSNLFWINVLVSIVLSLCVLSCSPLISLFYGKPELTAISAILSLTFILSGLTIQHQALQRRHMCFGTLAVIQIIARVISLVLTIFLARYGLKYWALVFGTLTNVFVTSLFTILYCPWIPSWFRKTTGIREMLKFGGHLTAFDFINYFSRNADNILIGRFIGPDALGLYTRAYDLFMLPINQIRNPLNQVAVPVLSSLKTEPERYRQYYMRMLDIMASLTMPLVMYCAIEADFLIRLLLGSQWLDTVPVFRILTIAGLIQALASTRGLVLISCGFSQRYLNWGIFNAIICVFSFVLGLPYGICGVATSYTIANYIILLPSLIYCFHRTPVNVSSFFKPLIYPFLFTVINGFIILIIKLLWTNNSDFLHLVCFIVFTVIYISLSLLRYSIRETIYMVFR